MIDRQTDRWIVLKLVLSEVMATMLNGYPEKSCYIASPIDFIFGGCLIFFPTALSFQICDLAGFHAYAGGERRGWWTWLRLLVRFASSLGA